VCVLFCMSSIKFGPTGIGLVGDAVANLERYAELGFEAAEVLFTYGVYIKERKDALRIGRAAKRLGIYLSVHASYFVNLNSKDEKKVEASKKRILRCCEVASWLGARRVVFHAGFYTSTFSKSKLVEGRGWRVEGDRRKDFEKIKEGIVEMQEVIKRNKWDVELCPEVMGKRNVFGSIDEVGDLVEATGCSVCIDVAHVLARYGDYSFSEIEKVFKMKKWHVHFSGIEYGEKGERRHLVTSVSEWEKVLRFLSKLDKDVVLICESPDAVEDTKVAKQLWEKLSFAGRAH